VSKPSALKLPTGLAKNVSLLGLSRRVARVTGQNESGVYKRVRRTLLRWLSQDISTGKEAWMYRTSGGARNLAWRINVSKLRALHPEFFEDISPRELETRVEQLESDVVELQWARDAMAAEIGKLRGQVAIARRASG
jgi:hypothetical protein